MIQIVLRILLVSIPIIIAGILISQKPRPSQPPPPSPPPRPSKPKNCSDVGEFGIDQDCCTGLSYNPGASCAYNFNCIGKSPDIMVKQDPYLKHNSGKQCINDKNCIVTSNGLGGFICVDKKYTIGGIGINGTVDRLPSRAEKQQCYKSIKPFEFPGKSEGCTTEGDRPVYICCNAATECCTPNVDKN